jgi:N-acetylmuramoyl-L-alanine amidase
MVHGHPWHTSRGIIVALTLLCAPSALWAQTLVTPPMPHQVKRVPAPQQDNLRGNPLRTRFLVGLPREAQFEVFSLSNPNRVIVELSETKLRLPAQPQGGPVGLIKSFSAGLSSANAQRSRIVIYVTEPVIVSGAKIDKGKDGRNPQLVVEIAPFQPVVEPADQPVVTASIGRVSTAPAMESRRIAPPPFALGAAGLQPPLPRPAVSPGVQAERSFKPVIVIDPGHGGYDSGATKNGAVEKDIVLAFSHILAKKLRATGRFKVMMTREKDEFIPLGDRVTFAEHNRASLFIAVHCDYADTGSAASGATIYSLRESVADSLRRSAKGELSENLLTRAEVEAVKKASVDRASGDIDAVRAILSDLADREVDSTRDRTSVFTRSVIETMGASTNMRNDPDQQASFRVLKTAQFPAVLIELAYVTNKQDAMNLQSDVWRDKVSDSIMTAVDNYFSNQLAQLPM